MNTTIRAYVNIRTNLIFLTPKIDFLRNAYSKLSNSGEQVVRNGAGQLWQPKLDPRNNFVNKRIFKHINDYHKHSIFKKSNNDNVYSVQNNVPVLIVTLLRTKKYMNYLIRQKFYLHRSHLAYSVAKHIVLK